MKTPRRLSIFLLALLLLLSPAWSPLSLEPSIVAAASFADTFTGDPPKPTSPSSEEVASNQIAGIIPVTHGHSIEEIVAMARQYPHKGFDYWSTTRYATTPRFTAPYAAGSLNTQDMADALNVLKMVRYLAGVPHATSTFTDQLNQYSQHGAVLLAASNQFTHYPTQPSDMDPSFFELAYRGCSEANLYAGARNLSYAVLGFIQDAGANNIELAGHRRWILMAEAKTFGMGFAQNATSSYGGYRISMHVLSNTDYTTDSDSYVAWPGAGNFPIQYFTASSNIDLSPVAPWSINLGTPYGIPDRYQVVLKLTRQRDLKTWTFNRNTPQLNIDNYVPNSDHLSVDNDGYGMEKAIIFRPNLDELGSIKDGDRFTVAISGITTASGSPTTLTYQIHFFDLEKYMQDQVVTFNSMGGSAVAAVKTAYGTTVTAPAAPTRIGHTFVGWYKDIGLTTPWNFATDKVLGAVTLYAKWRPAEYTVTYNSNGGTAITPVKATYNTLLTAPAAPVRTGYTFVGWYKDAALTSAWSFTTNVVTKDLVLYAKWKPIPYTVTFVSNGGTAVTAKTVNYDAKIAVPTVPTRSGWTFIGWFKESDFTTPWVFATDVVKGPTTLYAKWQIAVKFVSNGGTAVDPIYLDAAGQTKAPTAPTRTGYTFVGWYKDSALTRPFDFETETVTASLTLYAKWQINTYTVTFDSNGGSAVPSKTANYNTYISAPTAPTRTGYTFAGWYKDEALTTAWGFSSMKVVDPITLYAKWTPKSYTVTFNSNGGTTVAIKSVPFESTFTAPANPTKVGYTFAGWYRDVGLTTAWDFATDKVLGAMTLYAKWTPAEYTVTYNSNGGSAIAPVPALYNTKLTAPTPPTRDGYTFVGWYKDTALSSVWTFTTNVVTKDMTLYAKWKPIAYTVSFVSNGGTAVASKLVNYDAKITAPTNPTRTGYTFAGWFKDSDLSDDWAFASDIVKGPTTLYARWLVSPAANFAALAVSKTEIKLSWTTDPVAQGYEIYRATSSGGTYTKISGDATGGEYFDTGLTTGKTYYYKLRPWTMLGATKVNGAYAPVRSALLVN